MGSWVVITGSNFSPITRTWGPADFDGDKLPTSLDGVSVTVKGQPVYIQAIGPSQITALLHYEDIDSDNVAVQVKTPLGASPAVTVTKSRMSPALYRYDAEGRKYVEAKHADGSWAAKPGLDASLNATPARPGETITLYGTGFGISSPRPPDGVQFDGFYPLMSQIGVSIGTYSADVKSIGYISPGLCQITIVVPDMPDGDAQVKLATFGQVGPSNGMITVAR
jgi:uncharacterized protein (TIGR03437 family)